MSGAGTGPNLSRRRFLAGCGAVGVAATGVPAVRGAGKRQAGTHPSSSSAFPSSIQALGAGGRISPEGRQAIADVDRQFQQQRPAMGKTVDAVKDIGLDPSGNTPINGKLGSALSGLSNARITFPSDGTFLLTEQINVRPGGPIEIAGNGCSFAIPSGEEIKSFVFVLPAGSLISDITIDQSAKGAVQELSIQATGGVVHAKNVTIKGYAPAKPDVGPTGTNSNVDAMFSPIARTSDAVVRATNFTAVGGTAAGTHDEADLPDDAPENRLGAPVGIWIGQQNQGTIQMVNPKLSGWSNGMYAGRTKGVVEVRGGSFVNNFNAQTRIGGGSIVDGASMLLDDRQWSDKGPFKIGHQGVYAVRVDAKLGNQTEPAKFKNLKIVAKSMREGASLFDWESASGPGIVRNCHITNHLERPVFLGENPSAPAATNILVDHCLIDGSSPSAVMEMQNRPQSRIQNSCIDLPNAGPDSINGAQVGKGVSFGKQCAGGSGLEAPDKVGSGGNLSSLPAPVANATGNATGEAAARRRKKKKGLLKKIFAVVFGGFFLLVLLFLGMIAVVVVGVLAGFGALAALLGGD